MDNHRRGLLITAVGGLALSFDVPLVRLGDGDVWSIIALRSLATFAIGLFAWLIIRRMTQARPPFIPGKAGLLAALFYGLSTTTFLGAVFNSTTANVVFIVAFTPMFAGLLAWLFMNERPQASALFAMLAMLSGVGIIVSGGLDGGHLFGDMLAALTSLLLAGAITIGRKTQLDLGFTPLAATALPALIALVMLGGPANIMVDDPFWVLLDGVIMIPLAFWCLASGPRYLSGPEVGMFYLLETILAPLWVWIVFGEVLTVTTLVGGAILIGVLICHFLWQMKKRSALSAVGAKV